MIGLNRWRGGMSVLVCVLAAGRASAQEAQPTANAPDTGFLHRHMARLIDHLEQGGGDGLYPELGHMIPGAGLIKGGPGYRRHVFGSEGLIDASAAVSARRYSMARASLEWPHAIADRLALRGDLEYADATQINFFGVGDRTTRDAKTNYRLRHVDVSASAQLRLLDSLAIGAGGGLLRGLDVRRGLSALSPSVEQRFDDRSAPGLQSQPRYQHLDVFIESDTRDLPAYARRGGLYRVSAAVYRDVSGSSHGFRRVETEATQYVAVAHNSSLAVHGRLAMSQAKTDDSVPFYLLPTLGGGNTLRGYADYRFRDRNAAFAGAEYTWQVLPLLDAALFTELGTVAATPGDLPHSRLARDFGFGFRLHSQNRSIGRVDVARGSEGTRIVFSVTAPFRSSHVTHAPYVP